MKKGTLIQDGKNIDAVCPHCKATQPIGVWAAAHLSEILKGACNICGKQYSIGGKT